MNYNSRIDELERSVRMLVQAPTIPIFDTQNRMWPQDFDLPGQLVMDINFYNLAWTDENGSWNYGPTPDPSQVGNVPQDAVEGQIAIGSDGSLNWFIAGEWWTSSFTNSTVGNVPQDVLGGQIAIGNDSIASLHWYDGTDWNTFGVMAPGLTPDLYVTYIDAPSVIILNPLDSNDHLYEVHANNLTSPEMTWYLDGSLVNDTNPTNMGAHGLGFGFDTQPSGSVDTLSFYYVWDVKVGTTRGASDIFSDPLNSIPSSGWTTFRNETIGGVDGISTATHNSRTVVKMTQLGDFAGYNFDKVLSSFGGRDYWYSFNMMFSSGMIANLAASGASNGGLSYQTASVVHDARLVPSFG